MHNTPSNRTSAVKRFLKRLTGRLYLPEVESLAFERCGGRIGAGPFAGMRYIDRASCSALVPKLLGTYERELHPWIDQILARGYREVVDIGAAEGYYAAGFAMRMPQARVRAFDIDPAARRNLAALLAANQLEQRVSNEGACSFETMAGFDRDRCLVICDIEGAERDLLDPSRAPQLQRCDLLIEIHDGPATTRIHDVLRERFAPTHDLAFARYEGRTAADAAAAPWLGHSRNRVLAVDEQRTFGIEWGFFRARPSAG
jgi:hypothetical protein